MNVSLLSYRPNIDTVKNFSRTKLSAHYIKPCRILKIEFKNLRVRNEEKIDSLLIESLNVTYHLGSITAQQLHQIFGIGVALARSEMQKMWVRGLIIIGPTNEKMKDFKGFKFPMEQTKRNKVSIFDKPHILTEEGRKIITDGRFNRIQARNETLYFIEPIGLMLPRGTEIQNQKWTLSDEYSINDIKGWFEGEERKKRKIPDNINGIVLEEETILDDFLNIERVLSPTQLIISYSIPIDFGIWFIQFMEPDSVKPANYTVEKVGIWYGEQFHECEKHWAIQMPNGRIGKEWQILPAPGIKKTEIIKNCTMEKERFIIEIEMEKPPRQWIPRKEKVELPIIALDPDNEYGGFRLYASPIPTKSSMVSWIQIALDDIELPTNKPITQELLGESLKNLKNILLEQWITTENQGFAARIIKENLSVESYIEFERLRGNWLIKYRLEEKEVFSDAI